MSSFDFERVPVLTEVARNAVDEFDSTRIYPVRSTWSGKHLGEFADDSSQQGLPVIEITQKDDSPGKRPLNNGVDSTVANLPVESTLTNKYCEELTVACKRAPDRKSALALVSSLIRLDPPDLVQRLLEISATNKFSRQVGLAYLTKLGHFAPSTIEAVERLISPTFESSRDEKRTGKRPLQIEGALKFVDRFAKTFVASDEYFTAARIQAELSTLEHNLTEISNRLEFLDKTVPDSVGLNEALALIQRKAELQSELKQKRSELGYLRGSQETKIKELLMQTSHELGIPMPELASEEQVSELNGARAMYSLGQGKITIQRNLLSDAESLSLLADVILHEVLHAEQDALIIRFLADAEKIGQTITPEDINRLQGRYESALSLKGSPVSRKFLRSVLETRNGTALSPNDSVRAQRLISSISDLQKSVHEVSDAQKVLKELERLEQETKTGKVCDLGFRRNGESLEAFGERILHPFSLSQESRRGLRALDLDLAKGSIIPSQIQSAFTENVLSNIESVRGKWQEKLEQAYTRYRHRSHEVESHEIGLFVRLLMNDVLDRWERCEFSCELLKHSGVENISSLDRNEFCEVLRHCTEQHLQAGDLKNDEWLLKRINLDLSNEQEKERLWQDAKSLETRYRASNGAVATESSSSTYQLSDNERAGLDLAKEIMAKEFRCLKIESGEQVTALLQSCIDSAESSKKRGEKLGPSQVLQLQKLVETYKSDHSARLAMERYLSISATPNESTAVAGGTTATSSEVAKLEQSTFLESRRLHNVFERAKAIETLEKEGIIRDTLRESGVSDAKAKELERALLSTNREIRNRAEAEIATHYRTDAHGGRTEFTRQISGRMGALAMVASAVAPWLFSTSEDATTTIPASWNGKLRN